MAETTSIRVSKDVWRRLHELKNEPGQSMDDVLRDELDMEVEA